MATNFTLVSRRISLACRHLDISFFGRLLYNVRVCVDTNYNSRRNFPIPVCLVSVKCFAIWEGTAVDARRISCGKKGFRTRKTVPGCCDVSRDCNASEFGTGTLQAVKWQAAGLTGFYYRRTQTFSARHQLWVRPSLLSSDSYSGKDRNVKLTTGLNLMHWLRMLSFTSIFVYIFGVAIKYRENFVFHLSRG